MPPKSIKQNQNGQMVHMHREERMEKEREKEFEPPHDKTNNVAVRLMKTQISLGIHPVWSESSLCAECLAKDPSFLLADSKDSKQTGRMPRLIRVFAGHTATLLV